MKRNDISLFIMGLFYAAIGIIFLTVKAENIIKFIYILLGIIVIFFNALVLFDSITRIKKDKRYLIVVALSIIQIIVGVLLIVTESKVLLIVTGSILLVLPLLEILSAKDKKEQFKLEITKISLGVILIILGVTNLASLVFTILGVISLVFGIIYLVMALLLSILKDEIDRNNDDDTVIYTVKK